MLVSIIFLETLWVTPLFKLKQMHTHFPVDRSINTSILWIDESVDRLGRWNFDLPLILNSTTVYHLNKYYIFKSRMLHILKKSSPKNLLSCSRPIRRSEVAQQAANTIGTVSIKYNTLNVLS